MTRSHTVAIALGAGFLLAGAGVFFLSRQTKDTPSDVVLSDDGRATLEISLDSLPEGVRIEDVKIVALSREQLEPLSLPGSPASGYRLEPEGLVLEKPATVRVRGFLGADGTLPVLRHIHGGATVPVADMLAMVNVDTTETMVSGSIAGFSTIYIFSGLFDVTIDAPSVAVVGTSFEAKAVTGIKGTGRKWLVEDGLRGNMEENKELEYVLGTATVPDPWTLQAEWTTQNALDPRSIPDRPPATAVTGTSFTANGTFTCKRPGAGSLEYRGSIEASVLTTYAKGPSMTLKQTFKFIEFRNVLCQASVDSIATATAAPGTFFAPSGWLQTFSDFGKTNGWIGHAPPGKIKVIAYSGKYLPVAGLEIRTGPDCEAYTAPHWHAIGGIVTTLDGTTVMDPGSCAFGKVSENPAIMIDDPKLAPALDDDGAF